MFPYNCREVGYHRGGCLHRAATLMVYYLSMVTIVMVVLIAGTVVDYPQNQNTT